jgi:DNA-directed RNA polymerase specialized sigma subunit
MEGSFNEEKVNISRYECDRVLRSYREMNSILKSSRSWGKNFSDDGFIDEAAIQAQMYSIRSAILKIEDAKIRMFLYHYYIKGQTLKNCAKILGISLRSVSRLKSQALEIIACDLEKFGE